MGRGLGGGLLIALAGFLAAATAAAQDFPTVLPRDYVLQDVLNRQRIEAAIGAPIGSPRPPKSRPEPVGKPAPATTSTRYVASPAVSAKVRRQFVERVAGVAGLDGARRIEAALRRGDPVANWAQLVGGDGLKPGDLADALAGYWILNWIMATGGQNDRVQTLAVREQLRPILADAPAFARLDEAGRQEMAEVLILNFLIQHAAYDDAVRRGDQAAQRRLGDAAAARFRREMGLDLRGLALTPAGFVRR